MLTSSVTYDISSFFATGKCQKNPKKQWKEGENLPMKFSEKMWLMIILKVTKKQGFVLSL